MGPIEHSWGRHKWFPLAVATRRSVGNFSCNSSSSCCCYCNRSFASISCYRSVVVMVVVNSNIDSLVFLLVRSCCN